MFSTALQQSQGIGQNFRFPEGGIDVVTQEVPEVAMPEAKVVNTLMRETIMTFTIKKLRKKTFTLNLLIKCCKNLRCEI